MIHNHYFQWAMGYAIETAKIENQKMVVDFYMGWFRVLNFDDPEAKNATAILAVVETDGSYVAFPIGDNEGKYHA